MKISLTAVQFRTEEINPEEGTNEKAKQFGVLNALATKFGCQKFVTDYLNTFFMFGTLAEAQAFKEEVKNDVDFIKVN